VIIPIRVSERGQEIAIFFLIYNLKKLRQKKLQTEDNLSSSFVLLIMAIWGAYSLVTGKQACELNPEHSRLVYLSQSQQCGQYRPSGAHTHVGGSPREKQSSPSTLGVCNFPIAPGAQMR
jgi:hypothetical protein